MVEYKKADNYQLPSEARRKESSRILGRKNITPRLREDKFIE